MSNAGAVAKQGSIAPSETRGPLTAVSLEQVGRFVGTGLIPFALVAYLGLKGGGYDSLVRDQVGVIVWWIVLLGSLCGVLPVRRLSRTAWIAVAVMGAFIVWTGLSIGWADSAERSVSELTRVSTLGGVLLLSLLIQGRDGLRRSLAAVGAAIAFIGLLALMSRLHPSWFPDSENAAIQPAAQVRLNYPLNYWNGLADLIAIGIPILAAFALRGQSVVWRSLSAAAIPALILTAYFTLSRGGAISIAVGLAVLLALWPRRLEACLVLAAPVLGAFALVAAASQRDALADGLRGADAIAQGNEMLAMTIVVTAGVGLLVAALHIAHRYTLVRRAPSLSRRTTALAWAGVATVCLVTALAVDLPSKVGDSWNDFKEPGTAAKSTGADRFTSASGSNRYQFWQSAADAYETDRLKGIGAGGYEYWWAQNGSEATFVRDAHSLYLEILAELGMVGLLLFLALIGAVLWQGMRLIAGGNERDRMHAAAAVAALLAFLVGAAADWSWEMTVIPVAILFISGALLAKGTGRREAAGDSRRIRAGLAAASILALLAILPPLGAAAGLHKSQIAGNNGDLPLALAYAEDAAKLQPYAASPKLQEALVLEAQGEFDAAIDAARAATDKEPTNWRTWQVLSRLQAENADVDGSLTSYRQAKALNPRSALFGNDTTTGAP